MHFLQCFWKTLRHITCWFRRPEAHIGRLCMSIITANVVSLRIKNNSFVPTRPMFLYGPTTKLKLLWCVFLFCARIWRSARLNKQAIFYWELFPITIRNGLLWTCDVCHHQSTLMNDRKVSLKVKPNLSAACMYEWVFTHLRQLEVSYICCSISS